jgi:hypothetical protein
MLRARNSGEKSRAVERGSCLKNELTIHRLIGWLFVMLAVGCTVGCASGDGGDQVADDAAIDVQKFDATSDESIIEAGDDIRDIGIPDRGEVEDDSGSEKDAAVQPDVTEDRSEPPCPDEDDDGFTRIDCGGEDCDDGDPLINVDDDCDPSTLDIHDGDRDGFDCLNDCDDANPHVNPSRKELCGNGLDDDCDEDTPDRIDNDGDGFFCDDDCDDDNAEVHRDMQEICGNGVDDDCNSATLDLDDRDGDGLRCDIDCDDSDKTLPEADYYCGSDFLYVEDFESSDGGWAVSGDQRGWEWGEPRGEDVVSAASGERAWVTNLEGYYGADSVMVLTSPVFNMSGLTDDPVLTFNRRYDFGSGDQLWLELSLDGGYSWTHLAAGSISDNFYNAAESFIDLSDEWLLAKTVLTGAAGASSVRIRFHFLSDSEEENDGFAVDDVRIVAKLFDVSAVALVAPHSGCGDRSDAAVTLTVRNDSSVPISDFDIAYTVNDDPQIVETVASTLEPGQEAAYTFTQTVDLRTLGMHRITASVLPGSERDSDLSDNTLSAFSYTFRNLGTGDYEESFESGDGSWAALGTNSSWARGVPIGDVISDAADGQNAWVTNLWGASNRNEMSYLTSPCFRFSDLAPSDPDPMVVFEHNFEIDGHSWFEISLDGGATWNKLGTTESGVNWYNDSLTDSWSGEANAEHQWQTAYHRLTGAASLADVQLRFAIESNGNTAGMGVDHVRIMRTFDDPQLTGFDLPSSICESHETIPVTLLITNGGNRELSNLQVSYQVDSQSIVTETVTAAIPAGQSADHVFAKEMVVPSVGSHQLRFAVELPSDFNLANSTLETSFTVRPTVNAWEYEQDFELDNGGWWTVGDLSSWQHAAPLGAAIDFITTAAGGSGKAWITNPFGDYRNGETSYLMSPCIDFTGFGTDPVLQFDHIFETEQSLDTGWLEVSIDGGENWSKVGDSTTGNNWYNDDVDQVWSGVSGDAGEWRSASHVLVGVAGLSEVLLRFVLSTSPDVRREGFGVDNISFIE